MKRATLIQVVSGIYTGDVHLYRLDPPLDGNEYVVVAAAVRFASGPKTCIFAADEVGRVTDWRALPGSFRGALDHERALRNAGYEVTA